MRTADVVKFSHRNVLVLSIISTFSALGFIWPFFYTGDNVPRTQIFFWVATLITFILVVLEISQTQLDSKSVAILGVLSALIAALRPLGAGAIGIEPMWFLLILSARVFGPSFGFLLGLTSVFVSALLTGGLGPWLGYQIFAAAWIGLLAGALPWRTKLRGGKEIAMLMVFGVFASELFGILMDLQFWPWALGSQTQLSTWSIYWRKRIKFLYISLSNCDGLGLTSSGFYLRINPHRWPFGFKCAEEDLFQSRVLNAYPI